MSLFPMNARGMRVRLVQAGAAGLAAAMIAGCGSSYRSVVTSTNPSGPAAQPSSLAVVVSASSSTSGGIVTIVDYSGDTIMATATIDSAPLAFTLDETGSIGYTINSDTTLTNFPTTTSLQQKNITYSTLASSTIPWGLFSPSSGLWVTDLKTDEADVLTGSPETLKYEIPVAPAPIALIGAGTSGKRYFSISLNNASTTTLAYDDMKCNTDPASVTQLGEVDAISTTTYGIDARLAVGACPVYGVVGSSSKRLFVLNRGSDTISVINIDNATLDSCTSFLNESGQTVTCHPTLPLSTTAVTATGIFPTNCTSVTDCALSTTANLPTVAGPVYAEYNATTQQLVVADYDGGTISIIDVSLDEYGNDSSTFGTTYTVKVGTTSTPMPAAVTVLNAGDRAYTANQNDDSGSTGNGTVSIVNLTSHTLEKTLSVVGHPRTVVSTSNSLYGKVYVASPDSTYVTVIGTEEDTVDTTVLVSGKVIDVRTTSQDGASGGNAIDTSRRPGAGQPCYVPGTEASITACQTQ